MTPAQLQAWLEDHLDSIASFMDYEPTIESTEELYDTLGYWLDNQEWDVGDHELVHLGIDGTGSQFAAWVRPVSCDDTPVVFFGSEGGLGVLTATCQAWAQAIAHAPGIDEYPDDGERLHAELNWMIDPEEGDPEEVAEAQKEQAAYRDAVVERFGPLPALEELTADLGELDAELAAWVESRQEK